MLLLALIKKVACVSEVYNWIKRDRLLHSVNMQSLGEYGNTSMYSVLVLGIIVKNISKLYLYNHYISIELNKYEL